MKLLRAILISGLIFGIYGSALADEVDLERIVVTNKRASGGLDEAAENIAIVEEGEIAELPANDLGEVLSYVPGIDVAPTKGFGRASSLSIQGSDSRQVRVMIDGIPLNTQSSGQVNPSEFPIENIAKIEVIKGPGSSVWGSGLGGVINIITKETGKTFIPKGRVISSYSGFDTKRESAELSGKFSGLGYYLFSSYMDSGGKGSKSDVLEKKAFSKLSYDLKAGGKLTALFGYSSADVNSGEFPGGSWQAQPYRDLYGKLGWENTFGPADFKIDLKHFRKGVVTKDYSTVSDEAPYSRVDSKDYLYQVSLNSSLRPRKVDLLVAGMDFDNDTVKSSPYLSTAKNLKIYAPYINYSLKLKPWDINFGLRYDNNSEFGSATSPALGAVYHFENLPGTLVRAGVSRAFNAPPLLWKFNYNPGLSIAPNPDIKAERAWVYEAGLESRAIPRLWLKFSLYRSDVRDAISSAQNDDNLTYMKNFQRFCRQGLELDSRFEICDGLYFRVSAAFNDIKDTDTDQIVRGGGKARQSFNTAIEYKSKFGLAVSLIGYYNRWNEPADFQPNDRKMLCDLKITQEWKMVSLFFNVHNLNNSRYWADSYFPVPQRYFEGGLSVNW
ncbi:MAG: TonB-dependent receptor [Candidatus Omnitrophota bacterium]